MSRDVRKAMIEPGHPELSLSRQCRLVAISRSSLYYKPQPASKETLLLMRRHECLACCQTLLADGLRGAETVRTASGRAAPLKSSPIIAPAFMTFALLART